MPPFIHIDRCKGQYDEEEVRHESQDHSYESDPPSDNDVTPAEPVINKGYRNHTGHGRAESSKGSYFIRPNAGNVWPFCILRADLRKMALSITREAEVIGEEVDEHGCP